MCQGDCIEIQLLQHLNEVIVSPEEVFHILEEHAEWKKFEFGDTLLNQMSVASLEFRDFNETGLAKQQPITI
ncbi:MAG: hypothetical protein JSW66_06685 [Phycisphaerales bacterium]|nr:MAG: hypothetical protein JSW66_06685 [Phycisphaerales bacterium]